MRTKYSTAQIVLHWLSAIIILWATITGFIFAFVNIAPEKKEMISNFNVSLTTLFIPFFLIRLGYAFRHGRPNDNLLTPREEKISSFGHTLLYVNILVVLMTGVLMMERPINVFEWFYIPQPIVTHEITRAFNRVHIFSCALLALLVVGHVLAAVRHQRQGKKLLRRMGC